MTQKKIIREVPIIGQVGNQTFILTLFRSANYNSFVNGQRIGVGFVSAPVYTIWALSGVPKKVGYYYALGSTCAHNVFCKNISVDCPCVIAGATLKKESGIGPKNMVIVDEAIEGTHLVFATQGASGIRNE